MSKACRWSAIVATALLAVAGLPQGAAAFKSPVSFTASVAPSPARAGETAVVTVTAKVDAPYHIYSIVPVEDGPQATVLTVSGPGLSAAGSVGETTPVRKMDPNFNKVVGLHEGAASFTAPIRVASGTPPTASVPLAITVRYGACNATSCLPPKTITVSAPIFAIEAGPVRPEYTGHVSGKDLPDVSSMPAPASDPGLLAFAVQAFAAGLLALVTPCVFPMIPVTLAFFTKQAAKDGQSGVVRLAAVYSLGIVAAFTGIGGVLAGVFGATSANRIAANPWVNLVFAALFVVFGLALLEVVELRPPSALQRLAGARHSRNGTLGVLGMGLTFVVAAFTCTAPFLGTVLVAASTASSGAQWVRPIIGMVGFSTALALPFFLLALFPGLMARLPRSGAWLSTVKGALGFVEIAAALKFLSNSDLVWQWKVLTQPVMLTAWIVLALAAGAWLLGLLRIGLGAPPEGRPSPLRTTWAFAFFAVAAYGLWGLTGRALPPGFIAFLPPPEYGAGAGGASAEKLPFVDSLDAAVAQAKAQNKPIFIDFTGYTCTNCRYVEKNVFPVADVQGELERFVRVRLYTDGGRDGDKNQHYQEKTFGDVALPLYAVLSPDGTPLAHTAYTVAQHPDTFTAFLRQARERQVASAGPAAGRP